MSSFRGIDEGNFFLVFIEHHQFSKKRLQRQSWPIRRGLIDYSAYSPDLTSLAFLREKLYVQNPKAIDKSRIMKDSAQITGKKWYLLLMRAALDQYVNFKKNLVNKWQNHLSSYNLIYFQKNERYINRCKRS